MKIIIIGSGPAGLSAAAAASAHGAEVTVLERMPEFSVKLRASGGGRCNVSNTLPNDLFMERFGRNGRFMQDAVNAFPNEHLISFLQENGVPVSADDGFHYFPVSGKALDIAEAFRNYSRRHGAAFYTDRTVEQIEPGFHLHCTDGSVFHADRVILACGGTAFSSLGGTGKGLALAESLGHKITPPLPALAPVMIKESWIGNHAGLSLPDARLEFGTGRKKRSETGELLFTHKGFSGPCALNLSGALAEAFPGSGELQIRFQPSANDTAEIWRERFQKSLKESGTKHLRNWLAGFLPKALAERYCELSGAADCRCCEVKAGCRDTLINLLGSGIPLTVSSLAPMSAAMVMKGGVTLSEVNPKTMESRILPGLYFAGEILDLDGPCGGYQIRWACSGGYLAGLSAAKG